MVSLLTGFLFFTFYSGIRYGHAAAVDQANNGNSFPPGQAMQSQWEEEIALGLETMFQEELNPANLSRAFVESVLDIIASSPEAGISLEIFNGGPTALLNDIAEMIRVEACSIHHNGVPDVLCPPTTDLKQCFYQIEKPMHGYGGLQCRTQCDIIPCSEVPPEELQLELGENKKEAALGRRKRQVKSPQKFPHQTAIQMALNIIKENMYTDQTTGKTMVNVQTIVPDEEADLPAFRAIKNSLSEKPSEEVEVLEEANVDDVLQALEDEVALGK